MKITQEEIKKISIKLAKITPNNEEKLANNITSILEYVILLNEVDTTWVEPTVSVISKKNNLLREDLVNEKQKPIDLLKCSNQKIIANHIAINNIMK